MSDVQTTMNDERSRYEARVGGELAGFAEVRVEDGVIEFVHTEVDDAFAGQGVASELIRDALADVRRRGGLAVQPTCRFVKSWIDKHPDHQDLLA